MILNTLLRKGFDHFRKLNFFESPTLLNNQEEIRYQRFSTRILILIFTLLLSILFVYNATLTNVKNITIPNPTLQHYKQLGTFYSQTLSCPCSQISINHRLFLNITYSLHHVCSSVFITPEWISYIGIIHELRWFDDFRRIGPLIFQGIQSLCQLAAVTIDNSLKELYASYFISALIVPQQIFEVQVNNLVQQFIKSTARSFLQALRYIRDINQGNALLSAAMTNYNLYLFNGSQFLGTKTVHYDNNCKCNFSSQCINRVPIYQNESSSSAWSVPGFYVGCYILEGLRQSRLECLYNQSCLNELRKHLMSYVWIDVTPLNHSISSRFNPNTSFGEIIDELLVDAWNWTIAFEKYYEECQPKECSYTIISRNGIITIVTTLIGLVGGLITALKLIIPRIVQVIRWIMSKAEQSTENVVLMTRRNLLSMLIKYLAELNVFPSNSNVNDPQQLRAQRISTRAFIIVFSTSLLILLFYNASITHVETVTFVNPSLDQYRDLYSLHLETLTCPCSQISINRRLFLNVTYSLYHICHSIFITPEWISYIGTFEGLVRLNDFRSIGPPIFLGIQSLCQLAQVTIDNSLTQLYSSDFISAFILSRQVFHSEVDSLVKEFIRSTVSGFLLTMRTIRDTNQVNAFVSACMTNYWIYVRPDRSLFSIYSYQHSYTCSCTYSSQCIGPIPLYQNLTLSTAWFVPGFYLGCFILEGLRQSRLECLYNQSCLNELFNHLSYVWTDVKPLNQSISSRFNPNTSFGEIIDELLVDAWNWTIAFERYYEECQPKECSYTIISRNGIITIVTTLIGLVGGLITALKLIIPRFVQLKFKQPRPTTTGLDQSLSLFRTAYQSLVKLNLFPSTIPTTNLQQLRIEYMSTRAFLVIFSLCLIILLFYNAAITIMKTITITNPSLQQYNQLHTLYPNTLSCPCSQISINNHIFVSVNYSRHQICDSIYITSEWIAYVGSRNGSLWSDDFRIIGPLLFQGMQSLCELAQWAIENGLKQFYLNGFVSAYTIPEALFRTQVNSLVEQFFASITNVFLLSLLTIRDTTQMNALLAAHSTNYRFQFYNDSSYVDTAQMQYDNDCGCAFSSQCTSQLAIYPGVTEDPGWPVRGFYLGCFILEGLRQSRLECLYNQSCLNELFNHLSYVWTDVKPLNHSSSSRFNPNTSFGEIIDELLVDSWNWTITHHNYFDQCQPKECRYTETYKNGIITIITTVISLTGGLMTALKLLVPLVITALYRLLELKRKHRVHLLNLPNVPQDIVAEEI